MPDPHVLYIVTAVVVLGLVAWVVVVLSRPAEQALEGGPAESKPASDAVCAAAGQGGVAAAP